MRSKLYSMFEKKKITVLMFKVSFNVWYFVFDGCILCDVLCLFANYMLCSKKITYLMFKLPFNVLRVKNVSR